MHSTIRCTFVFSDFSHSKEYEEILIRLRKVNVEMSIIYFPSSADSSFLSFLFTNGFQFHYCLERGNLRRIKFLLNRLSVDSVTKLFLVGSLASYLSVPIVKLKRGRYIYVRHHGDLYGKIRFLKFRILDWLVAFFANSVVAVSQTQKVYLIEHDRIKASKIDVCYGGFDVAHSLNVRQSGAWHSRDERGSELIFGVMSRLVDWKGVNYILDAFQIFLADGYCGKLLIRGEGPQRKFLENSIRNEFRERVVFVDHVDEPVDFYRQIDVFVHAPITRYSESFGMVYLESLCLGIPSIFTASGIASELEWIRNYSLSVPYRSSLSLAEAMKWMTVKSQYSSVLKAPPMLFEDFTFEALGRRYFNLIAGEISK